MNEVLRQEKKYLMTVVDAQLLACCLSRVMMEDKHNGARGYRIRSLYFDTLDDRDFHEKEEGLELPSRIYLFQCLPKADKMELVIQKAVELGACAVIPVAAKRCVMKLDAKKEKNKLARWQQIAEAAAKQSKRRIIPEITRVMSMKEAVSFAADMDVKLFPYELAEGMERTRKLVDGVKAGQRIAVFIGPEGGFEDSEVEEARKAGFAPITLGKRILRTETAGFTVLAWLMYRLEDAQPEEARRENTDQENPEDGKTTENGGRESAI